MSIKKLKNMANPSAVTEAINEAIIEPYKNSLMDPLLE